MREASWSLPARSTPGCIPTGQSILDPAITRRVLERAKTPGVPTGDARWATWSPQEKRALSQVAEGMTNEEIGLDLGSSTRG